MFSYSLQVGELKFAGNGVAKTPPSFISVQQLENEMAANNTRLLERLKTDRHSDKLMQACVDDVKKHRMTQPTELEFSQLVGGTFSPRFSVEQGSAAGAVPIFSLFAHSAC